MIRVTLTLALAVAVVGVAFPAVERAGVHRSDAGVRAAVERLATQARALSTDSTAVSSRYGPARRTVVLDLPSGGVASAPLAWIRIGPVHHDGRGSTGTADRESTASTRIAWRVSGGTAHVSIVAGIALRAPDRGVVTLRSGGKTRLGLTLVRRDGRQLVQVSTG